MRNPKNHIKVLSALSLASSDTREDTLISVIVRTLFVKKEIKRDDLINAIKEEFEFEPFEEEINQIVQKLENDDKIEIIKENIHLTEEEVNRIQEQEAQLNNEDQLRFQNFKNFINDTLKQNIEIKQVKILWSIFLEYLYNSFYEYGYDALKTLHPNIENTDSDNNTFENILQDSIQKISKIDESLKDIFKETVEKFPDFASEKDTEFIISLAQKTLSFSSLGLKPELAYDTIDHNIVDWVLYLDTNVLYSLLNLHSHPENQACKALIKLVQSNKEYINIKFRYSEQTYKELGSKRDDFSLLDEDMTDSAIRALLKSEKLDDFSKKFYEDLLNDRNNTIHPSKIIDLSQRTLKKNFIEIGRTGRRLENIGNDYIESQMVEYSRYIDARNDIKEEFYKKNNLTFHPVYRSDSQIRHDISLREILLDSRNLKEGEELTLNNVKFFALTLDDLLISFDKLKIKDYHDKRSFPVFFKPSLLLNKLIKVLPIKTPDYKKAFIKAITTKGFHRNTKKSQDILKIVNYLKSQGIDDEKVIYNLISEDLFLDKFNDLSKNTDFDTGVFIESEINKAFKRKEEELAKTKQVLHDTEGIKDEIYKKNVDLFSKKNELEFEVKEYKKAIKKLKTRVESLEKESTSKLQTGINFEAAEEKVKSDKLKASLRSTLLSQIESIKEDNLKKWQRRTWWNLIWLIPLLICGYFVLIPNKFVNIELTDTWKIVLGVFAFIINIFFFKTLTDRYFNEGAKKARKENTKIPGHITEKLNELE